MKLRVFSLILLSALPPQSMSWAQDPRPSDARVSTADALARAEISDVVAARDAAKLGNENEINRILRQPADARLKIAQGVVVARKAAQTCALLRNENNHPQAEKIAQAALTILRTSYENLPSDRLERYYWESWIEGEVLQNKIRALELIAMAEAIEPMDVRLKVLKRRFSDTSSRR